MVRKRMMARGMTAVAAWISMAGELSLSLSGCSFLLVNTRVTVCVSGKKGRLLLLLMLLLLKACRSRLRKVIA